MISKALSKQKVIAGQRGLRMKSNIIQYKITRIIQSVSCKHHQNVNKESRTLFLFFAHTGLIIHSSKLCAISLAWVKRFFTQKWYTHDVHVVIQDGAEKVDERQKTQTPQYHRKPKNHRIPNIRSCISLILNTVKDLWLCLCLHELIAVPNQDIE